MPALCFVEYMGDRRRERVPLTNPSSPRLFVSQMVQFIKQEAEEKANEIRVAAEEVRERDASSRV